MICSTQRTAGVSRPRVLLVGPREIRQELRPAGHCDSAAVVHVVCQLGGLGQVAHEHMVLIRVDPI